MTLTDLEWTIDGLVEAWSDSEDTCPYAGECADSESAWLTNHTHECLPGWSFSNGTFSGPPVDNAYSVILGLFVESSDYVLANLGEIAELAAENA